MMIVLTITIHMIIRTIIKLISVRMVVHRLKTIINTINHNNHKLIIVHNRLNNRIMYPIIRTNIIQY